MAKYPTHIVLTSTPTPTHHNSLYHVGTIPDVIRKGKSAADGKAAKPTQLRAPPHDTSRATDRTAKVPPLLTDGENHLACLILGLHIRVAANPESMVQ